MDDTKDTIINGIDYSEKIADAIRFFWRRKQREQLSESGDTSNRGAVVGGKQMDGFVELLKEVACNAGIPAEFIITDKNYLPGFFRSSKDWDMLVVSPSGKLVAGRAKITSRLVW